MAHNHSLSGITIGGDGTCAVAGIIAGNGITAGAVSIVAGRIDLNDDALAWLAGGQPVRRRGDPLRGAASVAGTVISGGNVVVNGGSGTGRAVAPGGAPAAGGGPLRGSRAVASVIDGNGNVIVNGGGSVRVTLRGVGALPSADGVNVVVADGRGNVVQLPVAGGHSVHVAGVAVHGGQLGPCRGDPLPGPAAVAIVGHGNVVVENGGSVTTAHAGWVTGRRAAGTGRKRRRLHPSRIPGVLYLIGMDWI
ncbi:hypothetical protein SEVIR_5G334150v4 [Setaria viridis]